MVFSSNFPFKKPIAKETKTFETIDTAQDEGKTGLSESVLKISNYDFQSYSELYEYLSKMDQEMLVAAASEKGTYLIGEAIYRYIEKMEEMIDYYLNLISNDIPDAEIPEIYPDGSLNGWYKVGDELRLEWNLKKEEAKKSHENRVKQAYGSGTLGSNAMEYYDYALHRNEVVELYRICVYANCLRYDK